MLGLKRLLFVLFISSVIGEETRRTCRESLIAGLKAIFEDNGNGVCVSFCETIQCKNGDIFEKHLKILILQEMNELETLLAPMIVRIMNQNVRFSERVMDPDQSAIFFTDPSMRCWSSWTPWNSGKGRTGWQPRSSWSTWTQRGKWYSRFGRGHRSARSVWTGWVAW